jgi:hypothetical protein
MRSTDRAPKVKIVRLGLLPKPIAFRNPIAIPLCNAKYGAFLKLEHRCNNLPLRNAYDRQAKLPKSPFLRHFVMQPDFSGARSQQRVLGGTPNR